MKVALEALTDTADALGDIGAQLAEANAEAGPRITAIAAAGTDEISAAVTALFNTYGQDWRAVAADAHELHQWFTGTLAFTTGAYQEVETGNTSTLAPAPLGEGHNILSVTLDTHEFQVGIGPYFFTALWGWQKIG